MALLRGDPIQWSETVFQQRSQQRLRRRWWSAGPRYLMNVGALFCTAFAFTVQFGTALGLIRLVSIPFDMTIQVISLTVWVILPIVTLLPVALMTHFGLQFRTLLWTSNSITREKVTGTWDLLLLTGVNARRIILGKWWATVRRALPDYLLLGLMRTAVLLWVFEGQRVIVLLNPGGPLIEFGTDYEQYSIWALLLMTLLVMTFTVLNLLYTAAVGMLAALVTRRAIYNLVVGLVLRVVYLGLPVVVGILISVVMSFTRTYVSYDSPFSYVLRAGAYSAFTLGDNGMVIPATAVAQIHGTFAYNYSDGVREVAIILIGLFMAIGYYAVGIVFGLTSAERLTRRQEALPHGKPKVKQVDVPVTEPA